MKVILICPSQRTGVPSLAEAAPLAAAPIMGESVLEYWLSYLACTGVTQVTVLADDRVERIQALAGTGIRWGLEVTVLAESRELTPGQALLKYAPDLDPLRAQSAIMVLDHFPGVVECPLFGSYSDWFAALCQWMPRALTSDRVGMHEIRPGVWAGVHSHISPDAQLNAPCWVGNHVAIGPRAILGPRTIVEDGAIVDAAAELAGSWIGPDTFVGQFAEVSNSLAWGNTLVNWRTGSVTKVADSFLLCALRPHRHHRTPGWVARLTEICSRNKEEVTLLWKHLLLNRNG